MHASPSPHFQRAQVTVHGAVQGVGFRPHLYRLAIALRLSGWVQNSAQGVSLEVEGPGALVREFLLRVKTEKPPRALIETLEVAFSDPIGQRGFEIRSSDPNGEKCTLILPDLAMCPDCRAEIDDPSNRRFGYPFINCTNCGPRFSIIQALPYDRPHTSMAHFDLCAECRREYENPWDRRFHAQPNACACCGPHLELWDGQGTVLAREAEALRGAAEALRSGHILALKGLGGFQLMVDARNASAVERLRKRKHRAEKPFALMFPGLDAVREACKLAPLEEELLSSAESPMVLLERSADCAGLAGSIAPRNPLLGVMLPSTPLHHLLMQALGFPIVATSGNLSEEPMCIDEREALERLRDIADVFLVHDRPIVRPLDDSIVRVVLGRELMLRRARGYAPLPVSMREARGVVLAVGGHLKNSVALSLGRQVFLSQHMGDLETREAWSAFRKTVADLPRLYSAVPELIACDLHPDYRSTRFARESGLPVHPVQHHHAHALACMADNALAAPALAVVWDGTGFGPDGTIWGGEFLLIGGGGSFRRVAHLRAFRLPGGDAAIKQPRRSALGVLMEADAVFAHRDLPPLRDFSEEELLLLEHMIARKINAPLTSSAGRLFDAVASLLGLRQEVSFEGQAAMELEFCIVPGIDESYPFKLGDAMPLIIDWVPAILEILHDIAAHRAPGIISAKFHHTLAQIVVAVALRNQEPEVVLSGGCFQNRALLEGCVRGLRAAGFRPYWHRRVPPNDGGIALGQVMAVQNADFGTRMREATTFNQSLSHVSGHSR